MTWKDGQLSEKKAIAKARRMARYAASDTLGPGKSPLTRVYCILKDVDSRPYGTKSELIDYLVYRYMSLYGEGKLMDRFRRGGVDTIKVVRDTSETVYRCARQCWEDKSSVYLGAEGRSKDAADTFGNSITIEGALFPEQKETVES